MVMSDNITDRICEKSGNTFRKNKESNVSNIRMKLQIIAQSAIFNYVNKPQYFVSLPRNIMTRWELAR